MVSELDFSFTTRIINVTWMGYFDREKIFGIKLRIFIFEKLN